MSFEPWFVIFLALALLAAWKLAEAAQGVMDHAGAAGAAAGRRAARV